MFVYACVYIYECMAPSNQYIHATFNILTQGSCVCVCVSMCIYNYVCMAPSNQYIHMLLSI